MKGITPHNTGFASGGVTCKLEALCFYSTSLLIDSFVLRNPPERKARKRFSFLSLTPPTPKSHLSSAHPSNDF